MTAFEIKRDLKLEAESAFNKFQLDKEILLDVISLASSDAWKFHLKSRMSHLPKSSFIKMIAGKINIRQNELIGLLALSFRQFDFHNYIKVFLEKIFVKNKEFKSFSNEQMRKLFKILRDPFIEIKSFLYENDEFKKQIIAKGETFLNKLLKELNMVREYCEKIQNRSDDKKGDISADLKIICSKMSETFSFNSDYFEKFSHILAKSNMEKRCEGLFSFISTVNPNISEDAIRQILSLLNVQDKILDPKRLVESIGVFLPGFLKNYSSLVCKIFFPFENSDLEKEDLGILDILLDVKKTIYFLKFI